MTCEGTGRRVRGLEGVHEKKEDSITLAVVDSSGEEDRASTNRQKETKERQKKRVGMFSLSYLLSLFLCV